MYIGLLRVIVITNDELLQRNKADQGGWRSIVSPALSAYLYPEDQWFVDYLS